MCSSEDIIMVSIFGRWNKIISLPKIQKSYNHKSCEGWSGTWCYTLLLGCIYQERIDVPRNTKLKRVEGQQVVHILRSKSHDRRIFWWILSIKEDIKFTSSWEEPEMVMPKIWSPSSRSEPISFVKFGFLKFWEFQIWKRHRKKRWLQRWDCHDFSWSFKV